MVGLGHDGIDQIYDDAIEDYVKFTSAKSTIAYAYPVSKDLDSFLKSFLLGETSPSVPFPKDSQTMAYYALDPPHKILKPPILGWDAPALSSPPRTISGWVTWPPQVHPGVHHYYSPPLPKACRSWMVYPYRPRLDNRRLEYLFLYYWHMVAKP
ncbi:hypothetical protein LOK49_LG03G03188 [Camellia lanceoleosa]|uniref:Uncharacterized protein n=1 Tax=Camellia lanceoleosa TaxID=1840588 RepID=A0ACC0IFR9_9ERIC|nr:hypothetical protein LOK49_LG03G03188 [Camellia lanceoleosa]